jgi:hypothetical protein
MNNTRKTKKRMTGAPQNIALTIPLMMLSNDTAAKTIDTSPKST